MSTVVVAGALVTKAGNAGNAWTRIAWAGGLARLGFDVWLVEQLHDISTPDPAALRWAQDAADLDGLGDRLAVLDREGRTLLGPEPSEICDLLAESEMLLNIGGHLSARALGGLAPVRVFLDDDPGFTQIWEAGSSSGSRMDGHHLYLSYGANLGTEACPLPTCGVRWHPVRPAVLLDHWPSVDGSGGQCGRFSFTTVARWRSPFGAIAWGGQDFTLKHHEFRRVIDLPGRVDAEFELAVDIDESDHLDRRALHNSGWRTVAPRSVAGDLVAYRNYIRGSDAEFSAAQGVYVQASTGWVSDRTACYLASGRPALVQDTAMAPSLPVGDGLVPWTTVNDAEVSAARIMDRYDEHAAAARAIAIEHFDAVTCARRVCEIVGVAP